MLLRASAAAWHHRVRGAREIEQMAVLCLVELQRARERLQHGLGHAAEAAALEARVVVDGHSGEERHLFPAQTGDAPRPGPVGAQPRLFGRDPGASAGQELADLAAGVHGGTVTLGDSGWGAPPVPGTTGSVTGRRALLQWAA